MSDVIDFLRGEFESIRQDLADLRRRQENTVRHGRVTDVDAKKGLVRLEIGGEEGKPMKSPWIAYSQIAGARKVHSPPSVGQQMTLLAPGGTFEQSVAIPNTWSNDHAAPSDKPDEHVDQVGKTKITTKDGSQTIELDSLSIKAGGSTLLFDQAGLRITGGSVKHDGRNIGSSHIHSGVQSGGDKTAAPEE